MATWQAANLRLTAFTDSTLKISEPTWWEEIVGHPPEAKVQRALIRQETGPFEKGMLALSIQSGRVDWNFNPPEATQDTLENLPLIGPFTECLDSFSKITQAWLSGNSCPAVKRLAFGGILWSPVKDKRSGYKSLQSFLPFVTIDTEHSSDFLYQINRPRNSQGEIPNLTINRLSKWSVVTLRLVGLAVATQQEVASHEGTYCSLELDISTSMSLSNPLPQDKLTELFKELADIGKEISEQGDKA